MKITKFLPILALAGCANQPMVHDWTTDCERNFSYDSRELAACKERLAEHKDVKNAPVQQSNSVGVDPDNTENPTESSLTKGK